MLKNILSPKTCASCKICCIFDKYDIWETPIISSELKSRITAVRDDIRFITKGDSRDSYLFLCDSKIVDGEELFFCPALDPEKGCTLGENKPFECSIWPYRIMQLGEYRVIAVASICPEMYSKPLKALVDELERGLDDSLAEKIYAYADKNPDIVKPYQKGYPILYVRN